MTDLFCLDGNVARMFCLVCRRCLKPLDSCMHARVTSCNVGRGRLQFDADVPRRCFCKPKCPHYGCIRALTCAVLVFSWRLREAATGQSCTSCSTNCSLPCQCITLKVPFVVKKALCEKCVFQTGFLLMRTVIHCNSAMILPICTHKGAT